MDEQTESLSRLRAAAQMRLRDTGLSRGGPAQRAVLRVAPSARSPGKGERKGRNTDERLLGMGGGGGARLTVKGHRELYGPTDLLILFLVAVNKAKFAQMYENLTGKWKFSCI